MLWIDDVGSMALVDVGRGYGSGKRGGSGDARAAEVLERASHRTPVNYRNLNVLVVEIGSIILILYVRYVQWFILGFQAIEERVLVCNRLFPS
jgi:hypothetical protein